MTTDYGEPSPPAILEEGKLKNKYRKRMHRLCGSAGYYGVSV